MSANSYGDDLTLEFHDTTQLWVAYRECGCVDCPKGYGRTQEEAVEAFSDATGSKE